MIPLHSTILKVDDLSALDPIKFKQELDDLKSSVFMLNVNFYDIVRAHIKRLIDDEHMCPNSTTSAWRLFSGFIKTSIFGYGLMYAAECVYNGSDDNICNKFKFCKLYANYAVTTGSIDKLVAGGIIGTIASLVDVCWSRYNNATNLKLSLLILEDHEKNNLVR